MLDASAVPPRTGLGLILVGLGHLEVGKFRTMICLKLKDISRFVLAFCGLWDTPFGQCSNSTFSEKKIGISATSPFVALTRSPTASLTMCHGLEAG